MRAHLPKQFATLSRFRCSAGFTLLELVVAVAIFAVMGVAMFTQLTQVMTAKDRTDAYSKRLNEIQRAMLVIQQDVEQILQRPVRDQYGDFQPTVKSGLGGIEFTRTGWTVSPFTKQQRSELQRVRYSFEGGELIRSHWLYPDQASGEEPDSLVLLSGLEAFSVNFMSPPPSTQGGGLNVSAELNKSSDWPPLDLASGDDNDEVKANSRLPKLIEVNFTFERMGEITRLFRLISEHTFQVSGGAQGHGSGEREANGQGSDNDDESGDESGDERRGERRSDRGVGPGEDETADFGDEFNLEPDDEFEDEFEGEFGDE